MHIKRKKIRLVIASLKAGNDITTSTGRARIGRSTWYTWCKQHPRLERLSTAALNFCEDLRNQTAENELFRRIAEKDATPLELIFYLTNRVPERWRDRRAVVNNTNVNNVRVEQDAGERQFANEHDRAIANGMREWLRERTNGHKSR